LVKDLVEVIDCVWTDLLKVRDKSVLKLILLLLRELNYLTTEFLDLFPLSSQLVFVVNGWNEFTLLHLVEEGTVGQSLIASKWIKDLLKD
jgi:hypothetical protein